MLSKRLLISARYFGFVRWNGFWHFFLEINARSKIKLNICCLVVGLRIKNLCRNSNRREYWIDAICGIYQSWSKSNSQLMAINMWLRNIILHTSLMRQSYFDLLQVIASISHIYFSSPLYFSSALRFPFQMVLAFCLWWWMRAWIDFDVAHSCRIQCTHAWCMIYNRLKYVSRKCKTFVGTFAIDINFFSLHSKSMHVSRKLLVEHNLNRPFIEMYTNSTSSDILTISTKARV